MSVYSIPALSMENEFINLAYVARYVDDLLKISPEYAIVYQWNSDFMDGPPDVVLRRIGPTWETVDQV